MYRSHKYTVTQVTQWYLDRIARYDGIYKAVLHIDARQAQSRPQLRRISEAKSGGPGFQARPALGRAHRD